MADISQYVAQIEVASRGEDVRDAIVDALEAINDGSVWNADSVPTQGSTKPITSGGVYEALQGIETTIVVDSTPAQGSANPVSSGGVYDALQGLEVVADAAPAADSTRPVSSGGVYTALAGKQDVLVFDKVPRLSSQNPVTSAGIYSALHNVQAHVAKVSVTLSTQWAGEDPYTQVVTISEATAYTKVDMQPGETVIRQLMRDGVRAMWAENNNGVVTVICLGGHPSVELTIQCTLEQIESVATYDAVPTENSSNLVISGGVYLALSAKQDVLAFDDAPTEGSDNLLTSGTIYEAMSDISGMVVDSEPRQGSTHSVSSGGVYTALAGKQDTLTFDSVPTAGSSRPVTSRGIKSALDTKQDKLTFDGAPVSGSTRPVTSGGVFAALADKQNKLFFDTEPTEGSNAIVTSGGIYEALQDVQGSLVFDDAPTQGSTNPVTSGGIYSALQGFQGLDDAPRQNSQNGVKSGGVFAAVGNKQDKIWKTTLRLSTSWSGNNPYSQAVTIPNTTVYSMVELQPSLSTIQRCKADGIDAMWVDNSNGALTVYALGARPTAAMEIQCTVTEVGNEPSAAVPSGQAIVVDDALSSSSANPVQNRVLYTALGAKEATANKVTQITAGSTNAQYPTAKAVWSLCQSIISQFQEAIDGIIDGDEVAY